MRRKVLQHYADVLCHMAIGWRMGDDLETLADLPPGRIHFDVLSGQSTHDTEGEVELGIAGEMNAWLLDRLMKDSIPLEAIESATLDIEMGNNRIKTDKKRVVSFDWQCRSKISTSEKDYEVELAEQHVWHSRT